MIATLFITKWLFSQYQLISCISCKCNLISYNHIFTTWKLWFYISQYDFRFYNMTSYLAIVASILVYAIPFNSDLTSHNISQCDLKSHNLNLLLIVDFISQECDFMSYISILSYNLLFIFTLRQKRTCIQYVCVWGRVTGLSECTDKHLRVQ